MPADDVAKAPSPSRARRILRGVGRVLGALFIVVLLVLAVLLHDLDGKVRSALVEQTREIEALVGRKITIGAVHVTLGRTGEIAIHDLVVEAAPGGAGALAEPLLRVPTVHAGVRFEPLVRSWGKAIEITTFEIEEPEITLVRTPEGTSIDDVRARLAALPPPKPREKRDVELDRVALTGAKIHLRAAGGAPGADLDLEPINLEGTSFRPSAPSRLTLTAGAVPGAGASAIIDIAPAAGAAPGGPPALARLEVHASALKLAKVLAWLPPGAAPALDLDDAEVSAEATVEPGAAIGVKGKITLAKVRLALPDEQGEREKSDPTSLSLAFDAAIDPEASAVTARSFEASIGGLSARGKLTAHGAGSAATIDALELDASGEAASILGLLPAGKRPKGVALGGPVAVSIRGGGNAAEAKGTVKFDLGSVSAVEIGHGGYPVEGKPFALKVAAGVSFRKSDGDLQVTDAEVRAGDVVLRGGAEVKGLGAAPEIEALSLDVSGPSEQLLDLAPPLHRPPGVSLKGPFSATITAHGKPAAIEGKLTADLAHAAVHAPGFAKPAGVGLGVTIEARAGDPVELTHASLHLGGLGVNAHGKVHRGGDLDLTFDAKSTALSALLPLFPEAETRLDGATVDGLLTASGTVHRGGNTIDLAVKGGLREARIRRGLLTILGAPTVTAHVLAAPGTATAEIDADLGGATLAAAVFTKMAGKPARVAFAMKRDGEHVHVHDVHVAVPGASFDDVDVDAEPKHVHVVAPKSTIALGALADAVPLLRTGLPPSLADATIHFGLDLAGDPQDPASLKLSLSSIDLAGRIGHLKGSADVDGLQHPRSVHFEVSGGDLDLGSPGGSNSGMDLSLEDPSDVPVSGHVHLDSVRARGQTVSALDADLSLQKGKLSLGRLHAQALGGTVDVDKSTVDLSDVPELDLHARVDGVDLSKLGTPAAQELRGHASGRIDVQGAGVGWDAISRSLKGKASLSLRDVHARMAFTHKATLKNPLLTKAFARAMQKHAGEVHAIDLTQASAAFDVGSNKLTTSGPIEIRSDDLTAHLTGTIGLDKVVALEGQIDLAPKAISTATDGVLAPLAPIPLRLKLDNSPQAGVQIELLELGDTVRAFGGALRNGLFGEDP